MATIKKSQNFKKLRIRSKIKKKKKLFSFKIKKRLNCKLTQNKLLIYKILSSN